MPYRRRVRRPLVALASGAALTLAFPGYDLWWLAPIALGLLAVATYAVRVRVGLGLGILAGLAFFVPTLSWAGTDFLGVVPWLGLAVSQALFVGLFGAVAARLQHERIRPVAFALAWVAQEALRSRTPYGGFPWARVAFSQADSPLGRVAALAGAPGVAFGVALAGGLLAMGAHAAYRRGRGAAGRRSVGLGPVVAGLAVAAAGLLMPLPTDGPAARVLAIQGNVPRPGLDFNAERRAVLDLHVAGTIRAAEAGHSAGQAPVDLVVWPENASDIDPTRNPDAQQQIQRAVDAAAAPVLLGAILYEPSPMVSNATLLYRPGQGLVQRYVKQHPVPFAEYIPDREFFRRISGAVDLIQQEMASGVGPGVFRVPSRAGAGPEIAAGASICFEVAYDDLVRANVTSGANLLVVQTNNATFGRSAESVQQLAISRIRAIEHGRSIVHVSTVGVSALILPDGTLLQPTTLFTAAALDGELPLRAATTLATRLGPWPEYLSMLAALTLIAAPAPLHLPVARLRRRRKDRLPA